MTPLGQVPAIDPGLLYEGEPQPGGCVFFDTDAMATKAVLAAEEVGLQPLISSLVYAELARRDCAPKQLAFLDRSLVTRSVKVVPFDATAARAVFEVGRQMDFRRAPLMREGEEKDAKACYRRLRLDVFIFGAALRYRCVTVTRNWSEWQYFPFEAYRRSVEDFLDSPGVGAG